MEMTLRPATGANNRMGPRTVGPRHALPPGAARRLGWASRLGERYGMGGEAWDRLAATLRIGGPPAVTVNQYATAQHHWYRTHHQPPAVTLRLTLAAPQPTGTATGSPVAGGGAGSAPVQRQLERQVRVPYPVLLPAVAGVEHAVPTVTRVYQHDTWLPQQAATRITLLTAATPEGGAQPEREQRTVLRGANVDPFASMNLEPVPRVVNRPAPVVATVPPAAAPPPQLPAVLQHWGDPPAPLGQPVMNVEQLTDQVIRTIDQRVIAARERLGKS